MKSTVKRIAATALAAMMTLTTTTGTLAAEYYSGPLSIASRLVRCTATPMPTAEPEPTLDEAVPVATPEPPTIDVSKLKVEISTTQGDAVMLGETITLSSVLTGFEGLTYRVQWQFNDGSGWQDMPEATEGTYSFAADEKNVSYSWRLAVFF